MFGRLLIKDFSRASGFRQLGLQDATDYISSTICLSIYIICVVIVTSKTFFLNPMACMSTTSIHAQGVVNYMKNYCWVHGTIPLSKQLDIRSNNHSYWNWMDLNERDIYYQWLPVYFSLVGILSALPAYLWQWMASSFLNINYIEIVNLCRTALKCQALNDMNEKLNQACSLFCDMMHCHNPLAQRYTAFFTSPFSTLTTDDGSSSVDSVNDSNVFHRLDKYLYHRRQNSVYWLLTFSYFIFKLILLVSTILQMVALCYLLGYKGNFFTFGPTIFYYLWTGLDWPHTGLFPRISYCYVQVPQMGISTNHYLLQCSLPMNMLNEKICIFLWFWLASVALLCLISLWFWLSSTLRNSHRIEFIKHMLMKVDEDDNIESVGVITSGKIKVFVDNFLHLDGMLVLRMIQRDSGSWICSKLVHKLWISAHQENSTFPCESRHPQ